jgi:orotate phosphoribosyltransferase
VVLTQWTAHFLEKGSPHEVLAIFADKQDVGGEERLIVKRGYEKLLAGKRVLAVEDVLTTGKSLKQVVDLAQAHGGHVIGAGAICNRGGITAEELGSPFLRSVFDVPLLSWGAEDCPLCKDHVPVNTKLGHGAKFLQAQAA